MVRPAQPLAGLLNILFVIQSLERGGAEGQLALLAVALHGRGHTVVVAALRGEGPNAAILRQHGVAVHDLRKRGRWDLIAPLHRLATLVRTANPDVVHGYMPVANLAALLVSGRAPGRRAVFGVRASDMALGNYDPVARWSYRIERALSCFAGLVIANSQAGAAFYRRADSDSAVAVIPNGIDTERFRPLPIERANLRQSLGIGARERVAGLVARLDPMKDIDTFLRAAALVRQTHPDLRCLIIGDGPDGEQRRLHETAAALGLSQAVIWRAHYDEMAHIYNSCDVFALSSAFGEGFPNVVAEAMACGVRCAVTDVGDAAAIVGNTGRVVPARQPEALARAILDLLDRERADRLPDPRARIVAEFGIDKLVERTEAALQSLVS